MSLKDQLKLLYEIREKIRILQENGLWGKLQDSKIKIIKTISELESKND